MVSILKKCKCELESTKQILKSKPFHFTIIKNIFKVSLFKPKFFFWKK